MLDKGPLKVPLDKDHLGTTMCFISTDGPFEVYGLFDDTEKNPLKYDILGPKNAADRAMVIKLPPGYAALEVKCAKTVMWRLTMVKQDGPEDLDPVPLEVIERQLPLREQIRMYIQDELSAQANKEGMETLEESEDFDVDDEIEPMSFHELPEDEEFAEFREYKRQQQLAAEVKPPEKQEETAEK